MADLFSAAARALLAEGWRPTQPGPDEAAHATLAFHWPLGHINVVHVVELISRNEVAECCQACYLDFASASPCRLWWALHESSLFCALWLSNATAPCHLSYAGGRVAGGHGRCC